MDLKYFEEERNEFSTLHHRGRAGLGRNGFENNMRYYLNAEWKYPSPTN